MAATFTSVGESIKSAIFSIVEPIISGITDLFTELFIMEEGYVDERVELLRSKFAFIDSVIETVSILGDFFKNVIAENPPKIEMNLSAAESKYNYGTSAFCLDLSFYARYKPTGDAVLSGFLWIYFVWRTFVALPSIISGVGGAMPLYIGLNAQESGNVEKESKKE